MNTLHSIIETGVEDLDGAYCSYCGARISVEAIPGPSGYTYPIRCTCIDAVDEATYLHDVERAKITLESFYKERTQKVELTTLLTKKLAYIKYAEILTKEYDETLKSITANI